MLQSQDLQQRGMSVKVMLSVLASQPCINGQRHTPCASLFLSAESALVTPSDWLEATASACAAGEAHVWIHCVAERRAFDTGVSSRLPLLRSIIEGCNRR